MKLLVTVIISLVAYFFTPINANDGNPEGRIYFGKSVHDCQKYPWHAQLSIRKSENKTSACGGSLITDKYVLTAAHCTKKCEVGSEISVYLGTIKKRVGGKKYLGKLKACHYLYIKNGKFDYDIALLELLESVEMTPCINTISIFGRKQRIPDGLPVIAIGFGETEKVNYPSILQEVTYLRTYSQRKCEKESKRENGSFDNRICTKAKIVEKQSPCSGDSGGSLFYKKKGKEALLLGITSTGERKNCTGSSTRFTRVNHPKIISWINQMIK